MGYNAQSVIIYNSLTSKTTLYLLIVERANCSIFVEANLFARKETQYNYIHHKQTSKRATK